jgi:hypothetical protein
MKQAWFGVDGTDGLVWREDAGVAGDGSLRTYFETILRRYELADPVPWRTAEIVHEADLDDQRYDAPEAPGFDVALRGLSMVFADEKVLELTGPDRGDRDGCAALE